MLRFAPRALALAAALQIAVGSQCDGHCDGHSESKVMLQVDHSVRTPSPTPLTAAPAPSPQPVPAPTPTNGIACVDDDAGFQAKFSTTDQCSEWSGECLGDDVKKFCCATCSVVTGSSYVIWNAQSSNVDKAPPISFWSAFYAGNPSETGTSYDIGFDTHLMHGMVASDGSLIGVGFCLSAEVTGADRDITMIRASGSTGAMLNHWRSKWPGDDVGVAVGQFEDSLLVAGFTRPSTTAVAKRVLVKLKLSSLAVLWSAPFGDALPTTHSSFEAIAVSSTGVWLGGVKDNAAGQEFTFKSSGNIPEGTAFASFIEAANLKKKDAAGKEQAPASEDFVWSDPTWTSVKALDLSTEAGAKYVVAGLHKDVNDHPKGGLVKLNDNGKLSTKAWGPTAYDSQTEVTDVAVAPDGSGYIVTGHGSLVHLTNPTGAPEYYGRFTRVDTAGTKLWTVEISLGKPSSIYTECFAVQPIGWNEESDNYDPGWIAACGSGIEGASLCTSKLKGTEQTNCLKGIGDPVTPGAPARNPGVWVANIPRIQDSKTTTPPKVASMLLASYLQEGAQPGPQGSTGAEFITPTADGGFYVTTDEEFGAGFLRLNPEPAF